MDEGRWRRRWRDGMIGGRQWRDEATFRLFAGRGGALTACGAANFAAAPCEFARKLAARPHGSAGGWAGDGALVRLLFWVGRAGVTLGAAQTRQGTSGSLDSPFAAASSGETGCEPQSAGAVPRPSRDCAVSSYLPFPRNASQQSSRDHRGEDCVNLERQQLGAGSACRGEECVSFERQQLGAGSACLSLRRRRVQTGRVQR